mgnify:CR=1 FL=1
MICFCLILTCLTEIGLEFCKKIRETSETPVLFLTANDTEEDMLEGLALVVMIIYQSLFLFEVFTKKMILDSF